MPRYHTQQDVINRIGEDLLVILGDRNGDQLIEHPAVDAAIFDSEAEVDSYIGNRYALPLPGIESEEDPSLNNVPPILVRICSDITIYRLANEHDRLTEQIYNRYDAAIKWLGLLANMKVSLGIAESPPPLNGVTEYAGPEREFRWERRSGGLL